MYQFFLFIDAVAAKDFFALCLVLGEKVGVNLYYLTKLGSRQDDSLPADILDQFDATCSVNLST